MNIALEKCEEYVNGKLRRSYGDAFVRGNNGEHFVNVYCRDKELTLELLISTIHIFHMKCDNGTGNGRRKQVPLTTTNW
jgi:hypothetical protein